MGGVKLVAGIKARECQVIGRGDMPVAALLHHEREVLDVGIHVAGQDVEHGAAIGFFHFCVRQFQLQAHIHQVLVRRSLRHHGGQRLSMNLLPLLTVIALRQEVPFGANVYQLRGHHTDGAQSGHIVVGHLDTSQRVVLVFLELQQIIGVIL